MSKSIMTVFAILSISCILWCTLACNWLQGGSTLPRHDFGFAVGSYNDSIFILGGLLYGTQITEYSISNDTFHYMGDRALNVTVFGYSQFWTQQRAILYIIEWDDGTDTSSFGIFDMRNKTYTSRWNGIEFPTAVSYYSCLASSAAYLYVVGGGAIPSGLNTLQTLRLSTNQWIENSRSMNVARREHACIVHNNFLWSFGGVAIKTNERISTTNITGNKWDYVAPFPKAIDGLRAVIGPSGVYLISGLDNSNNYLNTVYMMNFNGQQLSLVSNHPNSLVYALGYAGIILVHSIIYVFGGRNPMGALDTWMYCNLSITSDTANPTISPSESMRNVTVTTTEPLNPSKYPTVSPSETTPTLNSEPFNPSTYTTNPPTVAFPPIQSTVLTTTISWPSRTPYSTPEENNDAYDMNVVIIVVIVVLVCVSLIFIVLYCKERARNKIKMGMVRDSYINTHPQAVIVNRAAGEHPGSVDVDGIEIGEHITREDDLVKKRTESNALEVRFWLEHDIGLPQYFDIFMKNGYESMQIIKEIVDGTELKDIGIQSNQHQRSILEGIQRWKREHNVEENKKREGSVWNDRVRETKDKAVNANTSGYN